MSIASPKLPPLILSTNGNGKLSNNSSPTIMKKEVNNNDLSTLSKVNNHHHLAQTSEESDDDKPLVMMANRHVFTINVDLFFFQAAKAAAVLNGLMKVKKEPTVPKIKKERKSETISITVKKETSPSKRKNAEIESDDDLPLVS